MIPTTAPRRPHAFPTVAGVLVSLVLTACSSSPPSDGPASTTPSQSSAPAPSLAAPSTTASAATSASASLIQTPEYQGVILTTRSASDLRSMLGKAEIDGTWVPTASDIAAFESGLAAYLAKNVPTESKSLPSKLGSYKRQWIGVSTGSKKLIYGNFFCRQMEGWEQGLIMVDDGGDCYFQLFYDVGTRDYQNLMINGDA